MVTDGDVKAGRGLDSANVSGRAGTVIAQLAPNRAPVGVIVRRVDGALVGQGYRVRAALSPAQW